MDMDCCSLGNSLHMLPNGGGLVPLESQKLPMSFAMAATPNMANAAEFATRLVIREPSERLQGG